MATKQIELVGLTGPLGAGKSLAASIIEQEAMKLGMPSRLIPFAEALKELAFFEGWDGRKDEVGRKMLQDLGHSMREKDKEYWVTEWYTRYRWYRTMRPHGVILVDDVRYNNEAKFIRTLGGKIIRINDRKGENNGHSDHPSEAGIGNSYVNQSVPNTGDIAYLARQLRFILKRYFKWEIEEWR